MVKDEDGEAAAAADADVEIEFEEIMKPGQKEMTPSPGNADRVFYETLLEQVRHVRVLASMLHSFLRHLVVHMAARARARFALFEPRSADPDLSNGKGVLPEVWDPSMGSRAQALQRDLR